MKFSKKLGMSLLGIWLILTGLMQVVNIEVPYGSVIMAVLAMCAGVLILFAK